MKIVYDENIPYAEAFFAPLGQLCPVNGRHITSEQLADADVLLVRSVTEVDADLLASTSVGFVGSCTIGTDHLDLSELERRGIRWSNAPGCNAEAVVNYVFSALLTLAGGELNVLQQRKVAVVGAGNVGGRLAERLASLGIEVLACDPPRAEREQGAFYTLDQVIAAADVICCHAPLTRTGEHPTYHLLDEPHLAALRTGTWLLNAGRGAVIDNQALCRLLPERRDLRLVLDVWEPEPAIDPRLVAEVVLATPHIAGYSLEGRARGTKMIYNALCDHLGVPAATELQDLLPSVPSLIPDRAQPNGVGSIVMQAYDIVRDDQRLRGMVGAGELPAGFDRLRREYPLRRDFTAYQLEAGYFSAAEREQLRGLGFRVVEHVL